MENCMNIRQVWHYCHIRRATGRVIKAGPATFEIGAKPFQARYRQVGNKCNKWEKKREQRKEEEKGYLGRIPIAVDTLLHDSWGYAK